jgi:hypothetical protein
MRRPIPDPDDGSKGNGSIVLGPLVAVTHDQRAAISEWHGSAPLPGPAARRFIAAMYCRGSAGRADPAFSGVATIHLT